MSSNGRDNQDPRGEIPPEEREAFRRRSEDLGRKLEEVQGNRQAPDQSAKMHGQGMADAFRYMIELLVGVCVGGGIGWLLDQWLGTTPLLLITLLLLGFVAGMVNMIRSAQRQNAKIPKGTALKADAEDNDK
ncbi:MAG: AtpZ/AtpI family protein [Hyphomicrobiaceae bacterium]